eukprot:4733604-Ditylum_brightwellii.AAC.1
MKAGARGGKTIKNLAKYNKFALDSRTKFRAGNSVYLLCGVRIDIHVANITTEYLHVCTVCNDIQQANTDAFHH